MTTIPLASPLLARSSDRPGSSDGPSVQQVPARAPGLLVASLFGLAPCGVLPATSLTAGAVRSYRTFSPLLTFALAGFGERYVFCATVLQVTLTGRYPAHCPAEFGLSSPPRACALRRGGRLAYCDGSILTLSGGLRPRGPPSPSLAGPRDPRSAPAGAPVARLALDIHVSCEL